MLKVIVIRRCLRPSLLSNGLFAACSLITYSSVKMLDFSFKIRETTRRGKLLKTLLSAESESALLDAKMTPNNACSICNEDVKDPSLIIDCFLCNKKFHVPCLKYPIPSDYIHILSTNPCLWWFCATCVSKAEVKNKDSATVGKMKGQTQHDHQVDFMKNFSVTFDEQFSSLKKELMSRMDTVIEDKFNKIVTKLTTDCSESEIQVPEPRSTYSSCFSSKEPTGLSQEHVAQPLQTSPKQVPIVSPEVLVLSPTEDHISSMNIEKMNKVKKLVEKKLKNCQVVSISCNEKNKKVSLSFPNCDVREKAATLINADDSLNSFGYQSTNAKKMLPKVTIQGVSSEILRDIDVSGAGNDEQKIRDLEKHEIVMKIVEKNPGIKELYDQGHTLSVVYLQKNQRNFNNRDVTEISVGIKVSPRIHQVIFGQQQGAIYLGFKRYSVSNRFYVKTCYHCQMVGHTSKDCKEVELGNSPTCMYCTGKHRSSSCTNKKKTDIHVCARCLASPHGKDAETAKTHNAASPECPILVREAARLAANTDFKSKNVM